MNNQKILPLNLRSMHAEKKVIKTEQSNFLCLIDRCTQILKEDKIFLRNRLKEGDNDILKVFRNIKKPLNMQLLQINLRKFLNQYKAENRMQQLTKYKQNVYEWSEQRLSMKKNKSKEKLVRQEIKQPIFRNSLGSRTNLIKNLKQRMNKDSSSIRQLSISQSKNTIQVQKPLLRVTSQTIQQTSIDSKANIEIQSHNISTKINANVLMPKSNKNLPPRPSLTKSQSIEPTQSPFKSNNYLRRQEQSTIVVSKQNKYIQIKQSECVQKIQPLKMRDSILTSNDDIFTSPELLQECRNFLKCNQFANMDKVKSFSKSINIQNRKNTQEDQNQQSSIRIVNYSNMSDSVEKIQIDLETERISLNNCEYSCEQIFDMFFRHPRSQITLNQFQSNPAFQRNRKLFTQLFQETDVNNTKRVCATNFGRVISKKFKSNQNNVKKIYDLIDIEQNGYFSKEDYERFLSQIVQSEQESFRQHEDTFTKVFKLSDVAKDRRIQYWALYLIKQTAQFKEFAKYLEQFEFEIEE